MPTEKVSCFLKICKKVIQLSQAAFELLEQSGTKVWQVYFLRMDWRNSYNWLN